VYDEIMTASKEDDSADLEQCQDAVNAIKERYLSAPARALRERDESIRELAVQYGLRQIDIIRFTGYSRETVRKILKSETKGMTEQEMLDLLMAEGYDPARIVDAAYEAESIGGARELINGSWHYPATTVAATQRLLENYESETER
jgi:hypothetical protein